MHQWFLLVGTLLIAMAFGSRVVQRLPLTPAMLYLAVGFAIGPRGLDWVGAEIGRDAALIELLAEIAVLVTLFSVGMRLRIPGDWRAWRVPIRLATVGMIVTTALTAVAAMAVVELPLAAALLLAAILAPTDPVLASDVQIRKPGERDAVRLTLTAEGGLNDGAAFPAVMLALGLMSLHPLGEFGLRWLALDLVWASAGGLALGWFSGSLIARVLRRLQRTGNPTDLVEFLVLGVIALTNGLALAVHVYGFLAVFAAGLAIAKGMHWDERGRAVTAATGPLHARLLTWTAQGERLCEVALVLLLGVLLGSVEWEAATVAFVAVFLLAVRPLAVLLSVPRDGLEGHQQRLVAWFGIRGVGSLYYLAFAIHRGVPDGLARDLSNAALAAIAASIALHGVSATPLMDWYEQRRRA
jgi:NhaP-type Na+/H+ or K+/H+ antiporter